MDLSLPIAASVVTSIVPALLLGVLPAEVPAWVLRIMMVGASGALIADCLLHMLPELLQQALAGVGHDRHHDHDLNGHDHDHHHDHHDHPDPTPMVLVLVGILAFFLLDGLMQRMQPGGHSHGPPNPTGAKRPSSKKPKSAAQDQATAHRATSALSLIADGIHNFSDGAVLAVAFFKNASFGWRTTFAVLLHEVPHELGDYAVLKSCGFSTRRIVAAQVLTGLSNCLGVVVFSVLGSYARELMTTVVMPLVAGNFLYLGLAMLMGEVRASLHAVSLAELAAMAAAFALGVGSVYAVSIAEELLGAHAH
jgi:zinc transporter ZupT